MPITSLMQTELEDSPAALHPVFELTLAGTTYRFAEYAVASTSNGLYKNQVKSWGDYNRPSGFDNYQLKTPRTTVVITDDDRTLQKALGGAARQLVRNSVVQCWIRGESLAEADHFKFFDGIVVDYRVEGQDYTFVVSPDTRKLNGNPRIPKASVIDFPNMPEKFVGTDLWVVYGNQVSAGLDDSTGFVKCVPADEDAASGDVTDWIASYGWLDSISRVFNGGTSDTSNWTIPTNPTQRGKNLYTIISYTGGTAPNKDTDIRIDCGGLRDRSPTTGELMTNPAQQIRHFLTNFCFGDGSVLPAASWEAENNKPIASTLWNATQNFMDYRGLKGAKVIRSSDKCSDVFNNWCDDFNAVPFWDDQYRIAARPEDTAEYDLYLGASSHIRSMEGHALEDLVPMDTSATEPITDLQINYLVDEAANTLMRSKQLADRRRGIRITGEDLDLEYGNGTLF